MAKSGISYIKSFFAKIFPCCFSNDTKGSSQFTIERAPEPSDVYWENLSLTSFQRFLRVAATYFATFIIIGICFAIIWGINVGKTNLEKNGGKNSGAVRFLSFVCSFVIIITNTSLRTVVRSLSLKEQHETYTAYNLSVAFKLAIVRFVNTAIVPTVVNYYHGRWFVDGGLVSDYFSIMISVSFTDPVLYLVDFGIIVQYLKKWYFRRQGKDCLLTQEEANELFQGPPLDMAN